MLSQTQLEMLFRNHIPKIPLEQIECIKEYNHVYRITSALNNIYYLKIFTKDWYGDDIVGTGFCVDHEITAWRTLALHGLGTPLVVQYDTGVYNPIAYPYVLTTALDGISLTELPDDKRQHALVAVGKYMRQMHEIRLPNAGYISSRGLDTAPSPNEWQHVIWTFYAFEKQVDQFFASNTSEFPDTFIQALRAYYHQHKNALEASYATPRFTHGDCHANQFYLAKQGEDFHVIGVVDMEVTSAGDYGADFLKFFIEAAALFPHDSHWWEALFAGYGDIPNFELIKLRMLFAGYVNYSFIWQGTFAEILQHIYNAQSWSDLFNIHMNPNYKTPENAHD